MVRLTILGDIDLRTDAGVAVGSVLSQPSRFALLVYLALEGKDGGVSRDRLLGVFWPETTEARGRQSLRTALHFLRRSLGSGTIVSRGDLVVLARERVTCDALQLLEALEADDRERAVRLYGGELLPGFHLDGGSVELERWLEEVRTGLRRRVATAAWALAEAEERAGNGAGAGAWARQAADLSSEDEAAARRAIELLGRVGDRAGALAVHAALARRLASFDASPSPETEAVVERIRGRAEPLQDSGPVAAGARRPADRPPHGGVPTGEAEPRLTRDGGAVPAAPSAAAAEAPGEEGEERRTHRWRRAVSAAGSLVLVLAFYSLWGLDRAEPGWTAPPPRPTLRIEELKDFTVDGGGAGVAGALFTELAGRLSDIDQLVVREAGVGGEASSAAGPHYVFRGGVVRIDSVVRVTATLLDAESGATLHRIAAEHPADPPAGPTDAVAHLADEVARDIRSRIGRAVDDRARRMAADDPRALSLVTGALREVEAADSLRNENATEAAEVALLAADSQLAAAQQAAPRWAEPSIQRAEVAFRRMWLHVLPGGDRSAVPGVLQEGVGHTEAALAIRRADPGALALRGTLEYWTWLMRAGGSEAADEEALRRAEADLLQATRQDPGLARAWGTLSAIRENRGDFPSANLAARRAYRANAFLGNTSEILLRLFRTSLEVGEVEAARHWCEELGRRNPGSWLAGYCALEQLAWKDSPAVDVAFVRAAIDSTFARAAGVESLRPRFELLGAVVLARSGHARAALAVVERAAASSSGDPELLKLEAWARLSLGQTDEATRLLRDALESNTRGSGAVLASRRFAPLRDRLAGEIGMGDGS